jgi:Protein of unknown function (DUF3568)
MNLLKSSRLLLRAAGASALLAILTLNAGCFLVAVGAAGAAGAGAVAYIDGQLTVTLNSDYATAGRAANEAVDQLKLVKINEVKDAFSDHILARMADDRKVTIVVTKVGASESKVEIRVGTFGDKDVSLTILGKIKSDL